MTTRPCSSLWGDSTRARARRGEGRGTFGSVRVALVSDIHGNDVAFDAVLNDIARSEVDTIICLGDVATLGPAPAEVIQRLRELGCVCVRGNHDDYLLDAALIDDHLAIPVIQDAINWSRDQLSADDLAFVTGFIDGADIALGHGLNLTIFHGSPSSNTEDLLATTPADELDRQLGDGGPVLAGGHTHIQMLRQHRGRVLVNPGSVGLPFREYVAAGEPTLLAGIAEYAIIDASEAGIGVTLRRVNVDRDALSASVRATEDPLGPVLRAAWRN
jgi:predicted phosphodiesterase